MRRRKRAGGLRSSDWMWGLPGLDNGITPSIDSTESKQSKLATRIEEFLEAGRITTRNADRCLGGYHFPQTSILWRFWVESTHSHNRELNSDYPQIILTPRDITTSEWWMGYTSGCPAASTVHTDQHTGGIIYTASATT